MKRAGKLLILTRAVKVSRKEFENYSSTSFAIGWLRPVAASVDVDELKMVSDQM